MKVVAFALSALACFAGCDASSSNGSSSRSSSPEPGTPIPAEIASKEIAFVNRGLIYTARADGTNRTLVASVPAAYAGPHWSESTGRFLIRTETDEAGHIFVISADGSTRTNVSRKANSDSDAMATWSPDGKRIAVISTRRGDRFPQLYVMDADGSNVERLSDGSFEAQYPAWSSDGSRIAFTGVLGSEGNDFNIFVIDAGGGRPTRVADSPDPENWPTWSPDSRQIAFSVEGEVAAIWAVNADGSGRRRITDPNVVTAGEPNWSRAVDWLAFDCGRPDAPSEEPEICAIRGDGSGFVRLFSNAAFPYWID